MRLVRLWTIRILFCVLAGHSFFSALAADPPQPEHGEPATESAAEKMLAGPARTNERARLMLDVLREKKAKFPNLSREIDEFVLQVAACEFFPNSRKGRPVRPIVIIGPPGIGKTMAFKEMVTALDLERVFNPIRVKEGTGELPFEDILLNRRDDEVGVQKIIFLDEIQNLSTPKPVDLTSETRAIEKVLEQAKELKDVRADQGVIKAAMDSLHSAANSLSYRVDSFQMRSQNSTALDKWKQNLYLLWHITGNGLLAEIPPLPRLGNQSTKERLDALLGILDEIPRAYKAWREAEAKLASASEEEPDKKRELHYAADNARSNYRKLPQENTRTANYLTQVLLWRPHLYSDLLKQYPMHFSSLGKWIEYMLESHPEELVSHIRRKLDDLGTDRDMDLSRTILILSGNDQPFLDEVAQRLAAQGKDPRDPDAFHSEAIKLINERGERAYAEKALRSVLGDFENVDALLSRMGIFGFKPTLSGAEIQNLIRSHLKENAVRASKDFKDGGFEIEVHFDPSVENKLNEELRRYHRDPRFIENEIANLTTHINLDLLHALVAHRSSAQGPLRIDVRFDPKRQVFTTRAKTEDQAIPELVSKHDFSTEPDPQPVFTEQKKEDPNYAKQKAVHQAAYGIVGSLLFKSLPKQLSIENDAFNAGDLSRGWNAPELDTLSMKQREVLLLLAGVAAEVEFMEDALPSQRSRKDRLHAERLIKNMISEMQALIQHRYPGKTIGNVDLSLILPNLAKQLIFREIGAGKPPEEILHEGIVFLRKKLRENEPLMERLGEALIRKRAVGGEDLVSVFAANSPLRRHEIRPLLDAELGSVASEPCHLIFQRLSLWGRLKQKVRGWKNYRWPGVPQLDWLSSR